MPIPSKPLVLSAFDTSALTLRENRVLFGDSYNVDEFYQYLLDHVDHATSWTLAEIGDITRAELGEVRAQLFVSLTERAVPLVSKPTSAAGRGSNAIPSRTGSASSSTPSASAATRKRSRKN